MLHIKKVYPTFTHILTTGDKFEKDCTQNGIIVANKGDLKLWQTVLSVGSTVRDIKVGDKVMIDISNYIVRKYSKDSVQNDMDNNPRVRFNFNWVTIDDEKGNPQECLMLDERDVMYVFEGEEKDEPIIEIPKKVFLA